MILISLKIEKQQLKFSFACFVCSIATFSLLHIISACSSF